MMRPTLLRAEPDRSLVLTIGSLGVTAMVTQIVILRTALSVFAGNELVLGLVLANWMVLTGAGSWLGRYAGRAPSTLRKITLLLLLLAVLPLITVFLFHALTHLLFPAGAMIGLLPSLYGSFLLLAPFCLVSGMLFTRCAQAVSQGAQSNLIAQVYALESAGALLGGLLFNLVLVFFCTTFEILVWLALLNCGLALWLARQQGRRRETLAAVLFAGLTLALAGTTDLETQAARLRFPGQELLLSRETPYGHLTVTQQGRQKNFYDNSVLLFSTGEAMASEEVVHFAMIQHPRPHQVLLISGGLAGTVQEILKYEVSRVDYVEINPWLIELGRTFTSALDDPRVRVITTDARRHVRQCRDRYQVAIIDLPDPGTAQINRYYTAEFLRELKARLAEDGIVSLGLLPAADYFGPEARAVSSTMYNTLKAAFRNVLILPGMRNYYLASDSTLSPAITARIQSRGLRTAYVNAYYIDDELLRQRSMGLHQQLDTRAPLNLDFTPLAYYRQLHYWLSYFDASPILPGVLLALVVAGVALKINPIHFGLFTGGFAAASLEFLLLVSFQILHGYVYQASGAIITLFMAGLAAGAYYEQKRSRPRRLARFITAQAAIGLYALLLPLVLMLVQKAILATVLIHALFVLLTLVISVLIGAEFSLATRLLPGRVASVAGELYGIDMIGSACGAVFAAIYLLPLLGITGASFVIMVLCFTSAVLTFLKRTRYSGAPDAGAAHV